MDDLEFKRFIEEVKLRVPIDDVVRERVPELRRAGRLFAACCPFHQERTPSFKVDPQRGTWHCFGACGTGGDAISFVQRFDGLEFLDALRALGASVGLELPAARGRKASDPRRELLLDTVAWAADWYAKRLAGPEGAAARAYLDERGIAPATREAFGLGWAPAQGSPLLEAASGSGRSADLLVEVGLARRGDRGRAYDFFRGRLLFPIRDRIGRPLAFGGRVLAERAPDGRPLPKYVNTPETALFHKGREIFGYDRALEHARRERHLVLVEGYTDVLAAHQVGAGHVAAVLGTATTEHHAALIRRSGARRVTLVFDGDEAGRQATRRALAGLLPLDLEIDVALLEGGVDPCDLCIRGGAEALAALVAEPVSWFEFLARGLDGLEPRELSDAVDEVLLLLAKLSKPVHREARLVELSERLGIGIESLREQGRALFRGRRREPRPSEPAARPAADEPAEHRRERRAWTLLAGALLVDQSLVPLARERAGRCPEKDVSAVLDAILALADRDDGAGIEPARVIDALLDDPARELVVPMAEEARRAESARRLAEDQLRWLANAERERALKRELDVARATLARADDDRARESLADLHRRMQRDLLPSTDAPVRWSPSRREGAVRNSDRGGE